MKMIQRANGLFLIILSICLALQYVAAAQDSKPQSLIRLKTGAVAPEENVREWINSAGKNVTTKAPAQVLLHFTTLPGAEQKETLKQNGITLLDYLPDNTYIAIVKSQPDADKLASLAVNSIITNKAEWKADNYLWKKVNKEKGAVEVLVSFYPGISADEARQYIASMGGRIDAGPMEQYGAYKVIIASGTVKTLAEWYGTRYISPVTEMVPLDLQTRPVVKGNIARAPVANGGYGLLGDSVTVGVGDNASGVIHTDLHDRTVNFNPIKQSNHGIHVNGIIGSAGIIDPFAEGQVPHVQLLNFFFDQMLPVTGVMYNNYNMTLTNNSYTVIAGDCDYTGDYDLYSRLLDTLAVQYPEVQHVFASGNDGLLNCTPYLTGFGTVGGGYQPAKNNIVVGSLTKQLVQAKDESRGPVTDGRLKPEITAVGVDVYSTIANTDYVVTAGTSMASPQVVGGLAALTQRYKQTHGGAQPRADLLKTILLSACMDLGNPGPDYTYGFGAMNLARSLAVMDNNQYQTGEISNGQTQQLTINIPANTAQVKVMLCWNDVPASPVSAMQLINDLDLTVADPSGTSHMPLVLDPAPANVNNNATEKEDHLNNVEQVTINSPAAGAYIATIKGHNIPYGPQHYIVAYDIVPKQLQLTFPIGGEALSNTDSLRVFWDDIPDGHTFSVLFSSDNGGSWQTISSAVPDTAHYCAFVPTEVNSGNCLVRVHRNGTAETGNSQRFTINTQTTVNLAASQCPGYLNVHWAPVPNATQYQLLKKVGPYMQVIDTITDTVYSFGGLSLTDVSYVAVCPIINGLPGFRSKALFKVANTGDCTNPASRGDLLVAQLASPGSGRMNTSSALSASTPVNVKIRNLYSLPCFNYTLSYKVNAGAWQTLNSPAIIPANSTVQVTLPPIDMTAPGSYTITLAVHNLDFADPQPGNDTIAVTIKNLQNDPINLATPFFDGFEDMPVFSTIRDSMGVSPNDHWDYANATDSGRLSSFIYDSIVISGSRSVSLDASQPNVLGGSKNSFTGTFNFSGYDTATTEIRVDFDYMLHSMITHIAGNGVIARSTDTAVWQPFYNYDFTSFPGFLKPVRSLSLTDAVRLSGHNFTSSTQVSFLQSDSSIIAARNYGNGITIDNFKMYTVDNDAMITQVISPQQNNCGLPAVVPLTVQVHNGVNHTLHNVLLYYSLDSGPVQTGTIDSIKPKGTINYTFSTQLNIGSTESHKLDVWLAEAGDTYTSNDSVLQYKFRNSRIITGYPYLENFENGDGGYYADGFNSSWQYGTPASIRVNKAASGTKAWKTNLTGRYNSLEKSFLYTPCFDISQLTNPMLSFSMALDVENCGGTLCDDAWVEYSFDGQVWTKLGAAGQGTNWYDSTFNAWNRNNFARWHVASIGLPQPPAGGTLHLRFVLSADPAVDFEGLAIDDIHVYDLTYPIYPSSSVKLSNDVSNNAWTDFLSSGQYVASINGGNQNTGNTTVSLYAHDTLHNPSETQYTFPRSYTIKPGQHPEDSIGIRLYLLDSDVVRVLKDTTCPSCTEVKDAYSLGITQYSNPNNSNAENGSLMDDTGGIFTFHPYQRIQWVPYDKGYRAELKVRSLSEFWFNDGGPTGNFPAGVDYLSFVAFRSNAGVTTYWYSLIDTVVDAYTLERADSGMVFDSVTTIASKHANAAEYTFTDTISFTDSTTLYYRLKWHIAGSSAIFYSPIRKITTGDSTAGLVVFDAHMAASNAALVSWVSYIDGIADHYILERAIDNGDYVTLQTTQSLRRYGQQYLYNDMPDEFLRNGESVHYRLTVVLTDGSKVVLPIRTVYWINGSAVTNIYPNPTPDGNFTIQWFASPGATMNVQITDAIGKTMDEGSFTATQWSNTTSIHTTFRPKGVYFVKMEIDGARYAARLVYE